MRPHRPLLATAAALGALGTALGAFGAHALEASFAEVPKRGAWWTTATTYLLVHALACGLAAAVGARRAGVAFAVGALLFSGSLYAMALTDVKKLGMVTPFGGVAFLVGWGLLVAHALGRDEAREA